MAKAELDLAQAGIMDVIEYANIHRDFSDVGKKSEADLLSSKAAEIKTVFSK